MTFWDTRRVANRHPPLRERLEVPSAGNRCPIPLLPLQREIGNRAVGVLIRRGFVNVQRGLIGDLYRFEGKRKAMMDALASTPQGQRALAVQDKYSIVLSWVDTGAASFDGFSRCELNQNLDSGVLAGYFIHEMYHVEQKKSGSSPDADTSPVEQEYVDRMVNEEIEGTALAFEARVNASGPLMPGEEHYRLAFKDAKGHALAKGADAATADAEARKAARSRVSELIRPSDKTWPRIAPNMFESYDMYYHRVWRKAQVPSNRQPATSPR